MLYHGGFWVRREECVEMGLMLLLLVCSLCHEEEKE
jgi:hypothetical protein